jgi:hypothetical protein
LQTKSVSLLQLRGNRELAEVRLNRNSTRRVGLLPIIIRRSASGSQTQNGSLIDANRVVPILYQAVESPQLFVRGRYFIGQVMLTNVGENFFGILMIECDSEIIEGPLHGRGS